eukprot:scaffold4722_cov60-Phaeocystis_antarctica.AAC.9
MPLAAVVLPPFGAAIVERVEGLVRRQAAFPAPLCACARVEQERVERQPVPLPRSHPARRSLRGPALGAADRVLVSVPSLWLVRVGFLDHLRLDHALGPRRVFGLTLDTTLRVAVSLARLELALGPLRRGSRHRQLTVRFGGHSLRRAQAVGVFGRVAS